MRERRVKPFQKRHPKCEHALVFRTARTYIIIGRRKVARFMDTVNAVDLKLAGEEVRILDELLESERSRLLVEIRHTDHRSYRDQLRHRLEVVEHLLARSKG